MSQSTANAERMPAMAMARISDMPNGEVENFRRQLEGKLDPQLVRRLLRNAPLMEWWIDALREHIGSPRVQQEDFTPTNEIVQAVLARSRQRSWRLPHVALQAMTSANFGVPRTSTADALITPDIWLGSTRNTIRELWEWFLDVHRTSTMDCDWDLSFATNRLRVVDPNRYGATPEVRWVTIDATAGLGAALPAQGRHSFAGLQLLTAAVVHPNWFRQLIQENGLWLGGLEARSGEATAAPWSQAPLLTMHLGTIVFLAEEVKVAHDRFLAPTFRDP